ncbi:hypothetical protein H6F89_19855 [Cyanobacteria bacterium FACHB-63]|nr:hypothetical protein [Cyanobacteria bacterium FACHB-63]
MNRRHLLQSLPKATYFMLSVLLVGILERGMPVAAGEKMQVELDVFSGRPNPRWELTPAEAHEFNRLLKSLPADSEGMLKEGLGYRGLIVTLTESRTKGYDRITISNGQVIVTEQGCSKQFADRDRKLERWLFQTGEGRLEEPLYQ